MILPFAMVADALTNSIVGDSLSHAERWKSILMSLLSKFGT